MKFFITFIFIIFLTLNSYAGQLYKVIKDEVNIRSDSTILSSVIGILKKNEIVEVIDEKFDWYKIKLPKRFFAYVLNEYVKELDGKRLKVEASTLNLRSQPSLESNIIGKAKNRDILNIIEKQDKWFKVSVYPFGKGWVYKNFLKRLDLLTQRGTLLFLKKSISKANFIIKTDKGKIPLLIKYKKYSKFINKKVEVVIYRRDNYFLVKKLKFLK